MRPALAALILLVPTGQADEPPRRQIEVTVAVLKAKAGGGNETLSTPSVVCPEGEECKLFIGQERADGRPDDNAIRIEVTPTITDDGRIRIRLVSLGTELGEQPGKPEPGATGKGAPESRITFHSALPSDGLYSVAGANGARSWLRIGQSVDGWKLSAYDAATRSLLLTQGNRNLRLAMAGASVGSPADASGRRTEILTVLPGEQAQVLGRNGASLTVSARVYADKPPAR